MSRSPVFLCLAHGFKGQALFPQARQLGVSTLLIARESTRGKWPEGEQSADETFYFPDFSQRRQLIQAVAYLARTRPFQVIVPLDELSVEVAADLREFLGLPGLNSSQARRFRDKLLMRQAAGRAGLPQPHFESTLNDQRLEEFLAELSGPCYLKPRNLAGSSGIIRVADPSQAFSQVQALGDQRAFYLIEEAVEGSVYHVDSLVDQSRVQFAQVHRYGDPPWRVSHQGGVFTTCTVAPETLEYPALLALNSEVVRAFELERGVTHAEFLERQGRFYFLEVGARVGGANIDVLVHQASGLNLWREWLRVELAALGGPAYQLPALKRQAGTMLTCLARQEWPDLTGFEVPELAWRLSQLHHAGMVLVSPDAGRLERLSGEFKRRLEQDVLAVLPPK